MTQGIFINGERPKSKKAIREAVEAGERVSAEATSWFGNEYDGLLTDAPIGTVVVFTGPDPRTKRNFYGTITVKATGIEVK